MTREPSEFEVNFRKDFASWIKSGLKVLAVRGTGYVDKNEDVECPDIEGSIAFCVSPVNTGPVDLEDERFFSQGTDIGLYMNDEDCWDWVLTLDTQWAVDAEKKSTVEFCTEGYKEAKQKNDEKEMQLYQNIIDDSNEREDTYECITLPKENKYITEDNIVETVERWLKRYYPEESEAIKVIYLPDDVHEKWSMLLSYQDYKSGFKREEGKDYFTYEQNLEFYEEELAEYLEKHDKVESAPISDWIKSLENIEE